MTLTYITSERTNGANPFKIFEAVIAANSDQLSFIIRRMPYPTFLKTAYWFAVSTVAKSKAGMRCQVCNSPEGIAVHHRTYDTHGREHANMVDLVVLCDNCHGLFHGHKVKAFIPEKAKALPGGTSTRKGPFTIPHSEEDVQIPDGETITLTHDLVQRCRANGSFTNATLGALGLSKATMTRGWTSRLVGKTLTREKYKAAVEGRFIYRSKLA